MFWQCVSGYRCQLTWLCIIPTLPVLGWVTLGSYLTSLVSQFSSSVKWRHNTGWLGGLLESSCAVLTVVSGTNVYLGSSPFPRHVEFHGMTPVTGTICRTDVTSSPGLF